MGLKEVEQLLPLLLSRRIKGSNKVTRYEMG